MTANISVDIPIFIADHFAYWNYITFYLSSYVYDISDTDV